MSYRLISSNDIAIKYPEVNDMPCIYADLPNGMDGEHYVLKQEPSGDLISRQAVLNTLDRMDKALDTDRTVESYKELLTECYKVLPSVKQEPKTGHWIEVDNGYICSECDIIRAKGTTGKYNYCPNCGCRMVESQERSDKE